MQFSHDLPESIRSLLDGSDLEGRIGQVVQLVVADENVPRVASLSVGELLAVDPRTIMATLYERSRTSRALTAAGTALLLVVDDGGLVKIEIDAQPIEIKDGRTSYHCSVTGVERDEVPYARLTQGIEFELVDRHDQVLARWREQLKQLKELRP